MKKKKECSFFFFHAKTVKNTQFTIETAPWDTRSSSHICYLFIVKEALGMIRTFIRVSLSIETIKGSGFVAYKFFQNWLRVPNRVVQWYMKGGGGVTGLWLRYFSPQEETFHLRVLQWERSLVFSLIILSNVGVIASQRPEVLQYRGHGPGAWASPTLDPWVRLKHHS